MLLISFHMLPKTGGDSEHIAARLPVAGGTLSRATPVNFRHFRVGNPAIDR
jgi:hypothetical protein